MTQTSRSKITRHEYDALTGALSRSGEMYKLAFARLNADGLIDSAGIPTVKGERAIDDFLSYAR